MSGTIERYNIERVLGRGAMGEVYLATDPKLNRKVAVKLLASDVTDAGLRERFRLEVRAIVALKHPNIVELYDYSGEDSPDLFLVMEYIPGPSLGQLINARGPMTETTALCIGHELVLALAYAHGHQVVHRDLKPENVMLNEGRVVLLDFGGVKVVATSEKLGVSKARARTQALGTPGFMPPEQFEGKGVDARSDIFGVGAVLYYLTTGRIPYEGGSIDAIYENLRAKRYHDPRRHGHRLTPAFCELLASCLAPRPRDRIVQVADLRERILDLLTARGVSEIRKELVTYERDPGAIESVQRERQIDILLRDLKVALKDREPNKARRLIKELSVLSPRADRFQDISGVAFDTADGLVLDLPQIWGRRSKYFAMVLGSGAALGFLLGWMVLRLLPDSWGRWIAGIP